MDTETTAAALVVASGAVAGLIRPALKATWPKKRFGPKIIQPLSITATAGLVVGWYAAQSGPMDWGFILPQIAAAWVIANGRSLANVATPTPKNPEVPKP